MANEKPQVAGAFAVEWMGRCLALVQELRDQGLQATMETHPVNGLDTTDGVVINITARQPDLLGPLGKVAV